MRGRTALLSLVVVGLVAGISWADDGVKKDGDTQDATKKDGAQGHRAELRKRLLEKFDADGDGKLNDEEKAKAQEAIKKHRQEHGERNGGKGRTGGKGRPDGHGSHAADFHKKLLEKFDADGDGKLNDEERAKAREEGKKRFEAMRAEQIKKFDADGDGKLNDEERAKLHEEMKKRFGDRKPGEGRPAGKGPRDPEFRKKMLEKFDADGDGKLNDEERAKLREELKKRFGDRKPGEGRPAGKGPRDPEFRKKMLEKFDADGDGKLNDEEKAKLREEMKAKRAAANKKAEL